MAYAKPLVCILVLVFLVHFATYYSGFGWNQYNNYYKPLSTFFKNVTSTPAADQSFDSESKIANKSFIINKVLSTLHGNTSSYQSTAPSDENENNVQSSDVEKLVGRLGLPQNVHKMIHQLRGANKAKYSPQDISKRIALTKEEIKLLRKFKLTTIKSYQAHFLHQL